MKRAKRTARGKCGGDTVSKSVSMPRALWVELEAVLAQDPELDFSGYARRLFRRDLEKGKAAA